MDFENKNKDKVGSLKVSIKMKAKQISRGNKREQGSKYGINTEESESVTLEEEEEEDENLEEDPELSQYQEQSLDEEQNTQIRMLGPSSNVIQNEQDEEYLINGQNMYQKANYNQHQQNDFANFEEDENDLEEDPIPDDGEDEEQEIYHKPSTRNPEYFPIYPKRKTKNQAFSKQNFRSASNKEKHLNFHQKAFKNRKASNRLYLKDSMTPHLQDKRRGSRNQIHNFSSHALTQYSPASFKEHKMLDIPSKPSRKKYKSRGRMVPSQSYGPGGKMHSKFTYKGYMKKPKQKQRAIYTPLTANNMPARFSTFDNNYEDESEEEIYDSEGYYSINPADVENIHNMLDHLYEQKHMLTEKAHEVDKKQNDAILLLKQVTVEREMMAQERMKIQMLLKDVSTQSKILRKRIEQAKRLGLKQHNSALFKKFEKGKFDKNYSDYAVDNLTSDQAYTEMEEGSPLPSVARPIHNNKDYTHQNVSELYDGTQNIQKRFAEDFDVNMQREQNYPMDDQSYEDGENFPPKNSNRDLTKEFNKEVTPNMNENFEENQNRSFESDQYPPHAHTQQIQNKNQFKNQNPGFDQRQKIPNENYLKYGEERKFRYNNDMSNDQNPYYDIRRSQERQNFQNQTNPNFSNSYYDSMQGNINAKSPVMGNYPPNVGMQPQYNQPELNNENQMNYNHPYQHASYMGGPYGEISFNKDYNNPNNIMSGSSTDRFQAKNGNQQMQGYMTNNVNPIGSNAPNSAYNSVPGGQDQLGLPPQHLNMNKDSIQNPPTFHPFHHHQLQNSSHLNSQNSTYTPPQITPKQGITKYQNFEGVQGQIPMNNSKPFTYEQLRELEQHNSFSMRERNPAISNEYRDSSLENNQMDQQRFYQNQIPRITGTQDSRTFNSIKEQHEHEEGDQNTPKTDKAKEAEMIRSQIEELNQKLLK